MRKTVIIGAGPTGMSAARHINLPYLLLEKESRPGGLMRSVSINGFTFDMAGHIFFTKDEYVRSLVLGLMKDNFHFLNRESWIYSNGVHTMYPFQANTFGLPVSVVKECLLGLIEAKMMGNNNSLNPENFEEWINAKFGYGIAKHFMIPYNSKLWKIPLDQMSCEWFSSRVPDPKIEDVLEGALRMNPKNMGPNAQFGYPLRGGCQAIADQLADGLGNMRLNSRITKINTDRRIIEINNSENISYDQIISTMPLPKLIETIENIPDKYRISIFAPLPSLLSIRQSVFLTNSGDLLRKSAIIFFLPFKTFCSGFFENSYTNIVELVCFPGTNVSQAVVKCLQCFITSFCF